MICFSLHEREGGHFSYSGKFEMSPVHVQDVSKIFVESIKDSYAFKKCFKLGGDNLNWKDIIKIISNTYNKNKLILPVPALAINMVALFLDHFE